MVIYLLLLIASYLFMEFVAWFSHKYIMHGFLWKWHADHHRKDHITARPLQTEDKKFEKNDLFFIVFALPGIILMIVGITTFNLAFIFMSTGITLYGLTYFLIHDVIIHRRINILNNIAERNRYLKAMIKAHMAHHHPKNKEDFNNFGLLVFHPRYFKEN